MRLALAGLFAVCGLAPAAMAQSTDQPAPAPSTPAAAPSAPVASTPADQAPPAAMAVPAPAAAPETPPPPPPAPPTDPAAIAVLSALESVCIPLVDGGDINKLAKADGFRKSGDNFVMRQKTFQLTLLAQGSNPGQCHVDIIHPVDPEAPAKPIVVALHNWAAVSRNWSLYRNDKNVIAGQEYTTRSWEVDADGKHSALVLTTIRKADGTPSGHGSDTSEMLYSATKTGG